MAGGHSRQRVALIITVLDEAGTIEALLDSITHQTRAPDEVVVVDGGSRDGTWELLQRRMTGLPLRCIQARGAGISRGRNLAVAATSSELIAVTDAGVRLEPDWLEALLSQLTAGVHVVSGFFSPDTSTTFERAMGATVLPALEDINPDTFLPSSRSVLFRRAAWAAVGGYPEWLDYCEDLVFNLDLKRAGFRFAFAPRARVHFRPRGSLEAFFRQYYCYARGDGKANLWLGRHMIRYATYAAAAALLLRSAPVPSAVVQCSTPFRLVPPLGWAPFRPQLRLRSARSRYATRQGSRGLRAAARRAGSRRLAAVAVDVGRGWGYSAPASRLLLALGVLAYTRRPYARLVPHLSGMACAQVLYALSLVPVIRLVGDAAKMLGYPVGVVWRLRRAWTYRS